MLSAVVIAALAGGAAAVGFLACLAAFAALCVRHWASGGDLAGTLLALLPLGAAGTVAGAQTLATLQARRQKAAKAL